MSITITSEIKNIDIIDWNKFVKNHPEGTIFQAHEMYRLFESSENYSPVIVAAYKDERITGLLLAVVIKEFSGPLGFLSSRTVVYGGPLIDNSDGTGNDITNQILKKLINKVKKRTVFIQFRNFHDQKFEIDTFKANGFKFLDRLNYLVDCTSEDDVKKRISSSKMRQVRKGLKAGAEIIHPESVEQVREFYDILYYLYKHRVKKPLPNWSFFENFYDLSTKGKLGIIKLVKFEGKIIGGIVSPVFDNKVIYEWYICGLDQEYKHVYPSVLATWAAIDFATKNKIKKFDFMGVGIPEKDYGVRDFKSKFGGELVNYGRFGRINNQFVYFITELGFNILALLRKI